MIEIFQSFLEEIFSNFKQALDNFCAARESGKEKRHGRRRRPREPLVEATRELSNDGVSRMQTAVCLIFHRTTAASAFLRADPRLQIAALTPDRSLFADDGEWPNMIDLSSGSHLGWLSRDIVGEASQMRADRNDVSSRGQIQDRVAVGFRTPTESILRLLQIHPIASHVLVPRIRYMIDPYLYRVCDGDRAR